jgi:hypothetical protein
VREEAGITTRKKEKQMGKVYLPKTLFSERWGWNAERLSGIWRKLKYNFYIFDFFILYLFLIYFKKIKCGIPFVI